MTNKIVKEFTTEEYNDILQIQESIRVAKKAAEEAHAKGMSRQEADSHIYDKVVDHIYSKPSQGAGGAVSRIKADMHTDKGLAHFDKLAKSKETKNESVEQAKGTTTMTNKNSPVDMYVKTISEQVRKERGYMTEESHSDVQKKVEKTEKIGVGHVASHGTHHVFSPYDSSTNDDHIAYIHHDTATGKNHHILLDTKKHSVASVHKQMNKAVPGGVHKDLAKKVADAHNEDFEHDD